mmetsp:Transcript_30726/g.102310  ORF Transcript_30726/g.102310 Transcript_30726/m.102310 type:complete len:571 (+) Transcript_30726:346-2058(+)
MSEWIKKHTGIILDGGQPEQYDHAAPGCRLLLRAPEKCQADASPSSARAVACAAAEPRCPSCMVRGLDCGFCGARSVLGGDDASVASSRCVAQPDDTFGDACAVRCKGKERTFDLSGGGVLSGLVEYPLWRKHGFVYAYGQQCTWQLGGSGGTVSGDVQHDLARYDALHLMEAGNSLGVETVGSMSENPKQLVGLAAPVTLRFFSDGAYEAAGFTARWDYSPPASGSSSSGGSITPSSGDTVSVGSNFFEGNGQILIIVAALLGCLVLVAAIGCIAMDCVRRYRRRSVSGMRDNPAAWVYATASTTAAAASTAAASAAAGATSAASAARSSGRVSSAFSSGTTSSRTKEPESPVSSSSDEEQPRGLRTAAQNGPKVSAAAAKAMGRGPSPPDASRNGSKGAAPQASQFQRQSQPYQAAPDPSPAAAQQEGQRTSAPGGRSRSSSAPPPRPSPAPPPNPAGEASSSSGAAGGGGGAGGRSNSAPRSSAPAPTTFGGRADGPEGLIETIRSDMLDKLNAPEGERKTFLRDLQRTWHPDKNQEEDKAVATAVFQYINANSHWFLGPGAPPKGS